MLELTKRDELIERRTILRIQLATVAFFYQDVKSEKLMRDMTSQMIEIRKELDVIAMLLGA